MSAEALECADRREYWTQTEVARLFRCSPGTVSKWVHQKKIDALRLPNGTYRISSETVDRIKRGEYSPPEEPQVNMKEVQQFEARVAAAHARLHLLTAPKSSKRKQKGKKQ